MDCGFFVNIHENDANVIRRYGRLGLRMFNQKPKHDEEMTNLNCQFRNTSKNMKFLPFHFYRNFIFVPYFLFWQKLSFLTYIDPTFLPNFHFDPNMHFWSKFPILTTIFIFDLYCHFCPKFYFIQIFHF